MTTGQQKMVILVCNLLLILAGVGIAGFRFHELSSFIPWSYQLDQDAYIVVESVGLLQGLPFQVLVHPGLGHKMAQVYYMAFLNFMGLLDVPSYQMFESNFFGVWQHIIELSRYMRFGLVMSLAAVLAALSSQILNNFKIFGILFFVLCQVPTLYYHSLMIRPEQVSVLLVGIGLMIALHGLKFRNIWQMIPAGAFFTLGFYTKVQVAPFIVLGLLLFAYLSKDIGKPSVREKQVARLCSVFWLSAWMGMLIWQRGMIPLPQSFALFLKFSPLLMLIIGSMIAFLVAATGTVWAAVLMCGFFVGHLVTALLFTPFLSLDSAWHEAFRHLVEAIDIQSLRVYTAFGNAAAQPYAGALRSVLTIQIPEIANLISRYSIVAMYCAMAIVILPIQFRRCQIFGCLLIALAFATICVQSSRSASLAYILYIDVMVILATAWNIGDIMRREMRLKYTAIAAVIVTAMLLNQANKFRDYVKNDRAGFFETTSMLYNDVYWLHAEYRDITARKFPTSKDFSEAFTLQKAQNHQAKF